MLGGSWIQSKSENFKRKDMDFALSLAYVMTQCTWGREPKVDLWGWSQRGDFFWISKGQSKRTEVWDGAEIKRHRKHGTGKVWLECGSIRKCHMSIEEKVTKKGSRHTHPICWRRWVKVNKPYLVPCFDYMHGSWCVIWYYRSHISTGSSEHN